MLEPDFFLEWVMHKDYYPKLLDETIIKEQDDKYLFLVPSKPDWIVTNRNGAIALSLCNGQNTLNDICGLLVDHPNPSEGIRLIETLQAQGFFKTLENVSSHSPSLLRSVHLNISALCNLRCNYCYAEERSNHKGQSLSLNEYRRLIDDLARINSNIEVAITGGEPLLNNSSCEISTYCRSKGFYTHLLTNGTLIDESNIDMIALSFDEIRVSVDGSSEATHDYHRGAGSFEKTTKAISLLQNAGSRLRLAMTVTKRNIIEVESAALRYGGQLLFQPLFNAGNAKDSNLAISGEDYFFALKTAKGVEPYAKLGQTLTRLKNKGVTKCAISDVEISISHNGDVYPCHMLHLPAFYAGNIREQTISDIYKNSPILNKLRDLSVNTRENCRECPVRLLCGGSCRARALYLTGNADAADSFCEYEFLAFTEGLLCSMEFTSPDSNGHICYECGN
jgi:radical SAM protein with 4Fe4S-binding SPASM domain